MSSITTTEPNLPVHEDTSATQVLYACESIPGKGKGLVATASIAAGTRILAESPLITVPRDTNNKKKLRKTIRDQLSTLPKHQREAYLSLSDVYTEEDSNELGIARTNALPLGSNARKGAVFLEASRINHACNANAMNTWNETLQKLTIHAARDIQQGEEITIYYLSQFSNRSIRQSELSASFRFACRCERCSLENNERIISDRRLEEIQRLDDQIGDGHRIMTSPLRVLHDVRALLALLHDEGITGSSEARAYYDGFQVAVIHGDLSRASELARRSATARAVVEGHDSPQVQRLNRLAADPSGHASCGRTKMWETALGSSPQGLSAGDFEDWLWRSKAKMSTTKLADLRDSDSFPTFDDLPGDNYIDTAFFESSNGFSYRPCKHWCFLAEITDVENFLRLALHVKDSAGETTRLMFYTDGRGQEVSPSQLVRGYTVALLYAEQHGFLDSSVGIRHEEPKRFKIFPVALKELLELSDRIQEHASAGDEGNTCHTCGKKPGTLKKCARCSLFWYCDKKKYTEESPPRLNCQAAGWTDKGHKEDCKVLKDPDLQSLFRLEWGDFKEYHAFS